VERVLRMALMHDAAEARTGDLPRAAAHYYPAEARREAERAAFDDMVADLDEARRLAYNELHEGNRSGGKNL
ncbi:MAG: HD domain-containing protein, partial [Acidobacteriota bacterium]|nr:HD domain-containing protein [Acidobacteriota bacterium]